MTRVGTVPLALALASGLAGCATPSRTVPTAHAETLFVARPPQDVLTALVVGAVEQRLAASSSSQCVRGLLGHDLHRRDVRGVLGDLPGKGHVVAGGGC